MIKIANNLQQLFRKISMDIPAPPPTTSPVDLGRLRGGFAGMGGGGIGGVAQQLMANQQLMAKTRPATAGKSIYNPTPQAPAPTFWDGAKGVAKGVWDGAKGVAAGAASAVRARQQPSGSYYGAAGPIKSNPLSPGARYNPTPMNIPTKQYKNLLAGSPTQNLSNPVNPPVLK